MTATQFYGGGGNLTGVGVDGIVSTANATAITIDSNENVGIGVTPSSWTANNYRALQVGGLGALSAWTSAGAGSDVILSCNTYHQAGLKYMITEEASRYHQVNGTHTFYTAESGTADSAISWTTALTITKEGKVGVGTTSPSARLNIVNSSGVTFQAESSNNEVVGRFKTTNAGFTDTVIYAQNTAGTGGSLIKCQNSGGTIFEVRGSGGITFNGDTAAANALDDYEEGTFTPYYWQDGGQHSLGYGEQYGYYTKVGNIVTCNIWIRTTSGSTGGGGNLYINGWPFTSANNTGGRASGSIGYVGNWNTYPGYYYHNPGNTVGRFFGKNWSTGNLDTGFNYTALANGSDHNQIAMTLVYEV
jgi:hypothetical protein